MGQRGLSSYSQYYKAKLESGLRYQDFVVDAAYHAGFVIVQYSSRAYQLGVGESRSGVEIKHDECFSKTGNLWIEVAEKATQRDGDYAVSGIYREGSWWLYAIGDYNTIFFFARNLLQKLDKCRTGDRETYRHLENNTKTSLGFLLPEADALKYASLVLCPNAAEKVKKVTSDLTKQARELHALVKGNPAQGTLFPLGNSNGEQEAPER